MMHIPNGMHLDRFHNQNGGSRSSRSAWPTLQVPGLHDRTLSKRGGRRERQRLPKNVKNKSLRGKNIFSPPARDVGYKEVAFLTTKQTTVSSQEAILTRICVYFPRSIRTIGLSWGEIHFKEKWRNCFIFIYLFQQTSQQQPQWMQAAWQPQVKGRCSLAFPYLKLSLLSRAMQCTWHMTGCPTNASSLLCAHFLLYSSPQGKDLTEKEEAKPLSVLQIII